jgi:hypothetical protein
MKGQRGQSLVEMAIAAPLLIMMFLGVFEVGWALRGYMVLANANREAVRFAVKNTGLDFSEKDPAKIGYNTIISHTTVSVSSQLPLEFLGPNPNATAIMTYIVVDTGLPCAKLDPGGSKYVFDETCDCTVEDPNHAQWYPMDDLVLHPEMPGYSHYGQTFGITGTRTTRLSGGSIVQEAEKQRLENNQFNCTVLKTGSVGETSTNNMVIIEMFYDQPQLLGVPFISNRLTDPIPFYAHTAMRIAVGRDTDNSDLVGPVCELQPITFAKQVFSDPENPDENTRLDLKQNGTVGVNDFNWVAWNPAQAGSTTYLIQSLDNSRLAIHDFTDASDAGDHLLNLGDQIANSTADTADPEIDEQVAALFGQTIRVPVYDVSSGEVDHIALLKVLSVPVSTLPDREITVNFLGYDDQACEE